MSEKARRKPQEVLFLEQEFAWTFEWQDLVRHMYQTPPEEFSVHLETDRDETGTEHGMIAIVVDETVYFIAEAPIVASGGGNDDE